MVCILITDTLIEIHYEMKKEEREREREKDSSVFVTPTSLHAVGFLFQILGWSISRGEGGILCGAGVIKIASVSFID